MQNKKKFKITRGSGFHITFKNGWTISVQFGVGNYADNHDAMFDNVPEGGWTSNTAEVLWWDSKGYSPCDPLSWQTPEEVLELMKKVSEM